MLLSQDQKEAAMMVEMLVGDSPETMVGLINVFRDGKKLRDAKNYDQALVLYLKLYDSVKQRLNPGHPLLVFLQVDLAGLYREMGNLAAAEQMMREAIKGSKMLFDNNPKLAKPLHEFARALAARGDVEEAARMYQRALAAAKGHDTTLESDIQRSLDELLQRKPGVEAKSREELMPTSDPLR
jgi:tetratricopeptide (TPR) repeat protein